MVKGCKGPFQLIKCLRHGFIIVLFKPFENVQLICFDQFQLTLFAEQQGLDGGIHVLFFVKQGKLVTFFWVLQVFAKFSLS